MSSNLDNASSPYGNDTLYSLDGLSGRDLAKKCIFLVGMANEEIEHSYQTHFLEWLRSQKETIYKAIDWCIVSADADDVRLGLSLAALAWRFWLRNGDIQKGLEKLQGILSRAALYPNKGKDVQSALGWTTLGAGTLSQQVASLSEARTYYKKSRRIGKAIGDEKLIVESLLGTGETVYRQSGYRHASQYFTISLTIARRSGYQRGIAVSLKAIGILEYHRNLNTEAITHFKEGLPIALALGSEYLVADFFNELAIATSRIEGQYEQADRYYGDAMKIILELQDIHREAYLWNNRSELAFRNGRWEDAYRYAKMAVAIYHEDRQAEHEAYALINLGASASKLGRYDQAYRSLARSLHLLRPQTGKPNAFGIPYALEAFAELLFRSQGMSMEAIRLLGAADSIRESTKAKVPEDYAEQLAELMTELTSHVNLCITDEAGESGARMSLDDAVDLALFSYGPLTI